MEKRNSVIGLILVGVCFMLLAVGSTSKVDKSKYNTSKTYKVGETLDCPYFDITVKKVQIKKKGTRIDSLQKIADPEWIGVTLTVKNKSSETRTFYGSNVDLINSNGEVLDHSWITYKIWGTQLWNSPELISGGKKTGYIQLTNTNTNNKNLTLRVKCNTSFLDDEILYNVDISKK